MVQLIVWGQVVDANRKELRNPRAHQLSATPSSPVEGQWWWDTVNHEWMVWDGTVARRVKAADSLLLGGQNLAYTLDLANSTNTLTASRISDFNTAVRTSTLNQMAAPTADLSMNTHKIIGLVAGSATGQAVEFDQLNTAIAAAKAGQSWKDEVRIATLTNDTLSGLGARDGFTLAVNDRVLVKAQTAGQDNGIYLAQSGAWTRATDADSASELRGGIIVSVDEGTQNHDTAWMLAGDVVTVGTTVQSWIPFGAGQTYTGSLGVQLSGSDFRANLGVNGGLVLSGNSIIIDRAGTKKVAQYVSATITGAASGDFTVNHALNNLYPDCAVYEVASGAKVDTGILSVDANNTIISFDTTPANGVYAYTIIG